MHFGALMSSFDECEPSLPAEYAFFVSLDRSLSIIFELHRYSKAGIHLLLIVCANLLNNQRLFA